MLLLVSLVVASCGKEKPTGPTASNPLDPRNPDPFQLNAWVIDAGVQLSWRPLQGPAVASLEVLRRDDRAGAWESRIRDLSPTATEWVDSVVERGHTYEYKVLALDASGARSAESQAQEARVDLDPVVVINAGVPLLLSRNVEISVLAMGARRMQISTVGDTANAEERDYASSVGVVLAGSEGPRTILCRVQYDNGAWSSWMATETILDVSAPVVMLGIQVTATTRSVWAYTTGTLDVDGVCPAESLWYEWDWGDGTRLAYSRAADARHTYARPGAWEVVVKVRDWGGRVGEGRRTAQLQNGVPNVPELLFPADGQADVSRLPKLQWRTSADREGDAVRYDVYLGQSGLLNKGIAGLADTTWSPGLLDGGVRLLWRVVAYDAPAGDPAQGDTSQWETHTFYTAPNSPPSSPSVPSPGDAAVSVARDVSLTWGRSVDPEGTPVTYDVYFGPTSNPPRVAEGRGDPWFDPTPGTALLDYETEYFWKVVAVDAEGGMTAGADWHFVTAANRPPSMPSNPSPADNASAVARGTTLSWGASVDPEGTAVTYDVYFGASTNPPRVAQGLTQASYDPTPGTTLLDYSAQYRWKIVARDATGVEAIGPEWKFGAVVNNPPTLPGGPVPVNNTTGVTPSGTLSWSTCTDPEGSAVTYDVYFGTSTGSPRVAQGLTQPAYDPTPGSVLLDYSRQYYWKVVAKDATGLEAAGQEWRFTTAANSPPSVPSGPSPVTNATGVSRSTTLLWNASTDPEGKGIVYDVYFGATSSPARVVQALTQRTYDPTPGTALLGASTPYYWRIVAKDGDGIEATGPEWRFTTASNGLPSTPANPSPNNTVTDVAVNVTLSWSTSSDPEGKAITYDVYFGTATNPPRVSQGLTIATYDPAPGTANLAFGTLYYWRVVARDGDGGETSSLEWRFTTGSSPGTGPVFALHAKAHTTKGSTLCTTWSPNSGTPIPCTSYNTSWPVGSSADVYLVVARCDAVAGLAGMSCGVQYNNAVGAGVDVYGWTLCADLEFTNGAVSCPPNVPPCEWPISGGGTRITWVMTTNCQRTIAGDQGVHAVAGAFYLYAYSTDTFQLTENKNLQIPELAVADCSARTTYLPFTGHAAKVGFGTAQGYNPCTGSSSPGPTTWDRIGK